MHVVCADSTCLWSRKTFSFQDTVVCAPTMIIVAIRISNTVFTTTPIGTNAKKSYGVELAATRTIFSPITNAGLFAKPSDNPRICTPGVNFLILKNWFSPNKNFFFYNFHTVNYMFLAFIIVFYVVSAIINYHVGISRCFIVYYDWRYLLLNRVNLFCMKLLFDYGCNWKQ